MKIALLGYGKEGKSAENYFKNHFENVDIEVLNNFTIEEIRNRDFSSFDFVFRSPSVPPLNLENESSVTRYFFEHCPCPIIGVTGTKGKGTTCSLINAVLKNMNKDVYLVGNIGNPALDVIDKLTANSIIVYEMSSFQLWDLKKSPKIAVVLRIEPDHLNVHKDFNDYVNAKSHIAEFQSEKDKIIYFNQNKQSKKIAAKSNAERIPYPISDESTELLDVLSNLSIPGNHNRENAEAALLAVAAFMDITLEDLLKKYEAQIKTAFKDFQPLPHHLEFVRRLNGVEYYDDSFSASYPSLDVALKAFPDKRIVLIAGGKDRNLDLAPAKAAIFKAENLEKAILIGETKHQLAKDENPDKYELADSLKEAVEKAKATAEKNENSIVLLSPGAASFDMFKDFYDRGEKFKEIVKGLK